MLHRETSLYDADPGPHHGEHATKPRGADRFLTPKEDLEAMTARIDEHLADLGIVLPKVATPEGSYVPYVVTSGLVFVSGQITVLDGEIKYRGRVGADLSVEAGYAAARLCGLNLLAQVRAACGDELDRVRRVVKLGGFVRCDPDFTDHPKVINGASDLMMEVFGETGRHARFAVGAPSLPLGVAVEVDGIFEVG